MHKACVDVQKKMKYLSRTWGEYYILKMDVAKYFESINHEILFNILSKKIKDKELMNLIKMIIKSGIDDKECGLQIGSYTSQSFGNIYLNELDKYVTEELNIKHYFRYADDEVLMVKTKKEAKEALIKIEEFLEKELKLRLNSKTQIFKSKQGVNFCGYKINENRMKIRDRGKRKLKLKVKKLTGKIKKGELTHKEAKKYLTGHMGYIRYADVNNLLSKLFYCNTK